jgi:hypothetical protein
VSFHIDQIVDRGKSGNVLEDLCTMLVLCHIAFDLQAFILISCTYEHPTGSYYFIQDAVHHLLISVFVAANYIAFLLNVIRRHSPVGSRPEILIIRN